MYVVRFSTYRVVEYSDVQTFLAEVGPWLEIREAENSTLLSQLQMLVERGRQFGGGGAGGAGGGGDERLLALKDGQQIVAAGILFSGGWGGDLCLTWASPMMVEPLVEGMAKLGCRVTSVFGPAHLAWRVAESWAARTNQRVEVGRAERIYQLSRVAGDLPLRSGRLEMAVPQDSAMLMPWLEGFANEASFEAPGAGAGGGGGGQLVGILKELLRSGRLFLWKDPHAVSMAAWTSSTAHGVAVNFVYTPAEFRGNGYAKATVAALAKHLLASGRRYCFIHTDTSDERSNGLYRAVGARCLCELLRCWIHPGSQGGGHTAGREVERPRIVPEVSPKDRWTNQDV